jgi:hypothetical protein
MKKILTGLFLFCLLFLTSCTEKNDFTITPVEESARVVTIDIYETTFSTVKLVDYVKASSNDGLVFLASSASTDAFTVSSVQADSTVSIFAKGTIGSYQLQVNVNKEDKEVANFTITVKIVDGSPDPTVKKQVTKIDVAAPKFADGTTKKEVVFNLDEYFDAADSITYSVECADETANVLVEDKVVTFTFTSFGEKATTIKALKNGEAKATLSFNFDVKETIEKQVANGNFEDGWTGWSCDEWGQLTYSINESPFDIWGNNVNGTDHYLYGYYNEAGTCEFASTLFKVGGTGEITFKMAGNCTDELQFKLMKYNANGEDEQIAVFNNWYFGKYGESGFIFRDYLYQMDLEKYQDALCYFVVVDNKTSDFGFICLDDIVTYHSTAVNQDDYYQAGYLVDPTGTLELDYSDTSLLPFETDETKIGYQLENGNFESGYDHWYMSTQNKQDYAIYDSTPDIWSNLVNATKHYLYGYKNEAAVCEFHSSLFKVGGTGLITFKMAGNSTADLQLKLMKYNKDGEDEQVAIFNNWYFEGSNESGFIFRQYYYQIDLAKYADSYLYFVVKDARTADFGFICLDDIVTYYAEVPALTDYLKAGYVKNPDLAA